MRQLQIRLVKSKKTENAEVQPVELNLAHKVAIVTHGAEKLFRMVSIAAIGYIALDTARTILVAKSTKQQ